MKKLTVSLLATAVFLMLCSVAYAGCGMTTVHSIVSRYDGGVVNNIFRTDIILLNITDESVSVTVDFYDHDGIKFGNDMTTIYKGSRTTAAWSTVSTNTNSFEIPAHSSRAISFNKSSGTYSIIAHALIRWENSNESLTKALVGSVETICSSRNAVLSWAIKDINNGKPF